MGLTLSGPLPVDLELTSLHGPKKSVRTCVHFLLQRHAQTIVESSIPNWNHEEIRCFCRTWLTEEKGERQALVHGNERGVGGDLREERMPFKLEQKRQKLCLECSYSSPFWESLRKRNFKGEGSHFFPRETLCEPAHALVNCS